MKSKTDTESKPAQPDKSGWLSGRSTDDGIRIRNLIDIGVKARYNPICLMYEPDIDQHWISHLVGHWCEYQPISTTQAQSLKSNPALFEQYFLFEWSSTGELDERRPDDHPDIAKLIATGIENHTNQISLVCEPKKAHYWIKRVTFSGLSAYNRFSPVSIEKADNLKLEPEQLKRFFLRGWIESGWLNEFVPAHNAAIGRLAETGTANQTNFISLLCDANSGEFWVKHCRFRSVRCWHEYQPVTDEQAQYLQESPKRFKEFVLHDWIEEGWFDERVALHHSFIDQLRGTDIHTGSESTSVMHDAGSNAYYMRHHKVRGAMHWFEYQPITPEQVDAIKQTSKHAGWQDRLTEKMLGVFTNRRDGNNNRLTQYTSKERNISDQFVETGVENASNNIKLMIDPGTNAYWIRHFANRVPEYQSITSDQAHALKADPEKFRDYVKREWIERETFDELHPKDRQAINALKDVGVFNEVNRVSLKQDSVEGNYWIKRVNNDGMMLFNEYVPVSNDLAQSVKNDPDAIFSTFVKHEWIESGWLSQFIPTHNASIEKLVDTGISNDKSNISLMHDPAKDEYWFKHGMSREGLAWNEYQPATVDQVKAVKRDSELLQTFARHGREHAKMRM